MTLITAPDWKEFVSRRPEAHILQSAEWGELKSSFGWEPKRLLVDQCGGQILFRKTPVGLTIGYLPKGPVGRVNDAFWAEAFDLCRKMKAIVLRVEPDGWHGEGQETAAAIPGFQFGPRSVQPRRTILIDLSGSETDWLARMKQKTRYNINLAERKGVYVQASADLEKFSAMMKITGERDGFGVHSLEYYRTAFDLFVKEGKCELLEAKFEDQTLAMMMVFASGLHGYYLYGASGDAERNRMPTYKLQWEAMKWCKARGCEDYDLYGIPDADEAELEAGFEKRSDGLWGVYRFKRGFGGRVVRSPAPLEKIFMPPFYHLLRFFERHD